MFVRANSNNKSKLKLNRFNGYVICFLFLILSILLILAYRIEIKIIQQNYKTHYESYIKKVNDHLIKEENVIILNNSKFDNEDEYYRYKHSFDDEELGEGFTEYNSNNTTEDSIPPEEDIRFDIPNTSEGTTDDIQNSASVQIVNTTEVNTKRTATLSTRLINKETSTKSATKEAYSSNDISTTTKDLVAVTSTKKQTSKFYTALKPKFEQLTTILDSSATTKSQKEFSIKLTQSNERDITLPTTEELIGETTKFSEESTESSEESYDPFKPIVTTNESDTTQKDYDPLKAKPIDEYITETVTRRNVKNLDQDRLKIEIPIEIKVDMTVESSTVSTLKTSTQGLDSDEVTSPKGIENEDSMDSEDENDDAIVFEEENEDAIDSEQVSEGMFNEEDMQLPLFPGDLSEEMIQDVINLHTRILNDALNTDAIDDPFNDNFDLDQSNPLLTVKNKNNALVVARVD